MKERIITKSNIIKCVVAYASLITIQCILLVLVALIPKATLQSNFEESANYLCEKEVFFYANHNDSASRIDRYADSILLNIAYNYNQNNPLSSVMSSSYYYDMNSNENYNFKTSVMYNPAPTLEYSRYWHGSIVLVRPLLTVFNINQIYIINYVILALLILLLFISIFKSIGKGAAICFIISGIMVSIWYVPMSLEYTWTMLLMLVASIICIRKLSTGTGNFLLFFFIVGNVTAYVDFLTTETITLLIPLILIITYNHTNGKTLNFAVEAKKYICYGFSWLIGYVLTWIGKWTLATIILQKNVFSEAINQATYRAMGAAENVSGLTERIGAMLRNISCLFPFSFMQENALFFAIAFLILAIIIIILIRKEGCVTNYLLAIVALVPYVRYFALGNHSYMHYFFTFRAQLATILCICLILVYGSDKTLISKEWRKLWKNPKKKNK